VPVPQATWLIREQGDGPRFTTAVDAITEARRLVGKDTSRVIEVFKLVRVVQVNAVTYDEGTPP